MNAYLLFRTKGGCVTLSSLRKSHAAVVRFSLVLLSLLLLVLGTSNLTGIATCG